jgi:hypothetical protein
MFVALLAFIAQAPHVAPPSRRLNVAPVGKLPFMKLLQLAGDSRRDGGATHAALARAVSAPTC